MIPGHAAREHPAGGTDVKLCHQAEMVRDPSSRNQGGQNAAGRASTLARGIAFGGDSGIAGRFLERWRQELARSSLGTDKGKYSFRQWHSLHPATRRSVLMSGTRAVAGAARQPNWNPVGSCERHRATAVVSPEEESMMRHSLPIALVVGVAFAPVCARPRAIGREICQRRSPPGDDMFPKRAGADAINNNCLAPLADMCSISRHCRRRQWE